MDVLAPELVRVVRLLLPLLRSTAKHAVEYILADVTDSLIALQGFLQAQQNMWCSTEASELEQNERRIRSDLSEMLQQVAPDMEAAEIVRQTQRVLSTTGVSAAERLEVVIDLLCQTSFPLVQHRLKLEEGKTRFGDLPADLQENIFQRALGDEMALRACTRVAKSWREICTQLTTWKFSATFQSLRHSYNPQDYPGCHGGGYEAHHLNFHLSPSDVYLVVRTRGRKHTGAFSVSFCDVGGKPCSLRRWLSDPLNLDSPTGVLVEKSFESGLQSRSEFVVQHRGLEIKFESSGRRHYGDVRVVLGKRLNNEPKCVGCHSWLLWRREQLRRESRITSIVAIGPR